MVYHITLKCQITVIKFLVLEQENLSDSGITGQTHTHKKENSAILLWGGIENIRYKTNKSQ